MECATGVHMTKNSGYINGSVRGLTNGESNRHIQNRCEM